MNKGVVLTLAILCLFYAREPLFAQNPLFNLNYQNNFPFERTTLFQHDLEKPQSFTITPAALQTHSQTIGYGQFFAPFNKPIYPLINDEELIYEYWYNLKTQADKITQSATLKQKKFTVDRKVFNALYNKPKIDEKRLIRLAWKRVFGVDVWYPYYKVKEIEDWVKEKVSVRVFGLKGRPRFENDQILYVFKAKF